MLKYKKSLVYIMCALIIAFALCGRNFMFSHPFSTQDNSLNESEIEFLSNYYVDDAESIENRILTNNEKELLTSYRALKKYMEDTYVDISYHITDVLPSVSSNLSYDMYCISVNGGEEYIFRTKKNESGDYKVIYDEYSHT